MLHPVGVLFEKSKNELLSKADYQYPHQWDASCLQCSDSVFQFPAKGPGTSASFIDIMHNYTEAPLRYEVAYPPLTLFLGCRGELAIRHERQFFLKWKKSQTPIMDRKWNEWKDLLCPKVFHVTVWSESPVVCIVHCSKIDFGWTFIFLDKTHFSIPS